MRKSPLAIVFAFSLTLAGCVSALTKPAISLPPPGAVSQIRISKMEFPGFEGYPPSPHSPVIKDSARISRILEFLAHHSRGWGGPLGTSPNPLYFIEIENRAGSSLYLLFLGDSIGVMGSDQTRSLNQREQSEFRQLLGIPDDPPPGQVGWGTTDGPEATAPGLQPSGAVRK